MPIQSGQRGVGGVLAVPALRRRSSLDPIGSGRGATTGGGPGGSGILQAGLHQAPFRSPPFDATGRFITGVTRDSGGTPLGGVTCDLYLTREQRFVDRVVSDGSGNFTFGAAGGPYFLVFYKAGSPDVFGSSVNTLTGAPP